MGFFCACLKELIKRAINKLLASHQKIGIKAYLENGIIRPDCDLVVAQIEMLKLREVGQHVFRDSSYLIMAQIKKRNMILNPAQNDANVFQREIISRHS